MITRMFQTFTTGIRTAENPSAEYLPC